MKAWIKMAAPLLLAIPTCASASCYYIYSAQNELVYRSTISPVDLSRPISDGLRGRFSGSHLTMIPDETGCPDLLAGGESSLFASLGFTAPGAGRNASAMEASPLFRGAGSTKISEGVIPVNDVRLPGRRNVPTQQAPAAASRG